MFKQGNPGGGRPKKSKAWKIAEDDIRRLLPGLLMMNVEAVEKMAKENPSLGFITVLKFIKENPAQVVAKFIPEAWADDPEELLVVSEETMVRLRAERHPRLDATA